MLINALFTLRLLFMVGIAFASGYQVAKWQENSAKLVQVTRENEKAQIALDNAAANAVILNEKLTSLKNEAMSSIRALANETQKPVFHTPCVTDDYVRLLNEHTKQVERTLSGKRDSTVPDNPTNPKRRDRP